MDAIQFRMIDTVPHPYLFVFMFLAIFQLYHLSQRTAAVLIGFFKALMRVLNAPAFQFPDTITTIRDYIGFEQLTAPLTMYVVCPACHAIYPPTTAPDSCETRHLNSTLCGTGLFKISRRNARQTRGTPLKQYAYYPLRAGLQKFFKREGFEQKINRWRQHRFDGTTFWDVFHGDRWTRVKDQSRQPFVDDHHSLLLTLNVDWFAPFDSGYSCGAIYLSVNNLPRAERYRVENVLLVGIMPGPKEPKTFEINSYLKPLVDDLLELYVGVQMRTFERPQGVRVRAALFNVACDIPASRKVSGFTSHASTQACNKCTRSFTTDLDTGNMVYAGVDIPDSTLRTKRTNREAAEQWLNARTGVARTAVERSTGTRWSQLHRLNYFDPIRCTIIDPMHNLFLGTAARMVAIWKSNNLLTDAVLAEMQRLANRVVLPPGMPTLQRKIKRKFGFMTADDWRVWTLAYSPVVLASVLSAERYRHWILFVDACRLLVRTRITYDDIADAHTKLVEFVDETARLYTDAAVTPNMHLHLHLRDVLQDFGPVYSVWLFAFERYNGIVKDADTNQKDCFKLTFMKRFIEKTGALDFVRAEALRFVNRRDELSFLLEIAGQSLNDIHDHQAHTFDHEQFLTYSLNPSDDYNVTGTEPLPPATAASMTAGVIANLSEDHYRCLLEYYRATYSNNNIVILASNDPAVGRVYASRQVEKFRTIEIYGQTYRSAAAASSRGAHIQVLYLQNRGLSAWTGRVQYYFSHSIVIGTRPRIHYLAFVQWHTTVENRDARYILGSVEEWGSDYNAPSGLSIIPVHRIHSQVAVIPSGSPRDPQADKIAVLPLAKRITF